MEQSYAFLKIENRYANLAYTSHIPVFSGSFPDDYVIDETKSKDWNKEKVSELNHFFECETHKRHEEQTNLSKQFRNDLIEIFATEHHVNEEHASHMISLAWEELKHGGSHFFNKLRKLLHFYKFVHPDKKE